MSTAPFNVEYEMISLVFFFFFRWPKEDKEELDVFMLGTVMAHDERPDTCSN